MRNKKYLICKLILLGLFIFGAPGFLIPAINKIHRITRLENDERTSLIQKRVNDTIELVERLAKDEYITSKENTYQEKAAYLTNINNNENLGYLMIRILDEKMNIYREDSDIPVSNLSYRQYMNTLYATGETQITDALASGSVEKTIVYSIAAAIEDEGEVVGAIFAAIYKTEIDKLLEDNQNHRHILVGSEFQFIGGVSENRLGIPLWYVIDQQGVLSRKTEDIISDFDERKAGFFWGIDSRIEFFDYTPLENCSWIVLTEASSYSIIKTNVTIYGIAVGLLFAAGITLHALRNTKYFRSEDEEIMRMFKTDK